MNCLPPHPEQSKYEQKSLPCFPMSPEKILTSNSTDIDLNHNKTSSNAADVDQSKEQQAGCCFHKERKRSSLPGKAAATRKDIFPPNSNSGSFNFPRMSFLASPGNTGDDSVFFSQNYTDEVFLTIGLCRDYVCCKLKRSGLGCRVVVKEYAPAKDQNLSHQILNIGQSFENSYPNVYKNVSKKLGYVFDCEQTVRRLYYRIATHVIGFDSKDFTWGRVLSLFCLAGAMSVDCISQGHSELVEEIIKISSDYLKQHVLEWIINQGGWKVMPDHFKNTGRRRNFGVFEFTPETKYIATTLGFVGMSLLSTLVVQFLM